LTWRIKILNKTSRLKKTKIKNEVKIPYDNSSRFFPQIVILSLSKTYTYRRVFEAVLFRNKNVKVSEKIN